MMKSKKVESISELKPGTQIAYVPAHAHGDTNHASVEFGFVTSIQSDGAVFCRYWRAGHPGKLRTVANSELTYIRYLWVINTHPQAEVDILMQLAVLA